MFEPQNFMLWFKPQNKAQNVPGFKSQKKPEICLGLDLKIHLKLFLRFKTQYNQKIMAQSSNCLPRIKPISKPENLPRWNFQYYF